MFATHKHITAEHTCALQHAEFHLQCVKAVWLCIFRLNGKNICTLKNWHWNWIQSEKRNKRSKSSDSIIFHNTHREREPLDENITRKLITENTKLNEGTHMYVYVYRAMGMLMNKNKGIETSVPKKCAKENGQTKILSNCICIVGLCV